MSHTIRELQLIEADLFLELYRNIFPNKTISLANVQSIFNTEPATVWVCETEQKKLTAFLYFWRVPDGLEVIDVGVYADFRRQGLGEALMQKLIAKAQNESSKIFLEVAETNVAAFALYQKLGFQIIDKRLKYYASGETALRMQYQSY